MHNIKVIKLIKTNIHFPDYYDSANIPPIPRIYATSFIPKFFKIGKITKRYFIQNFEEKEKRQYQCLLRELNKLSGDTKIDYEKLFLPRNWSDDDIILSQINEPKKNYDLILFDIVQSYRSFVVFVGKYEQIYDLFNKGFETVIFITHADDIDFLRVIESMGDFFEFLRKENKELVVARENGDIFYSHANFRKSETKAMHFKAERLKIHFENIIKNPEFHYYGHHELSSKAHAWVFQDFYLNFQIYENKPIIEEYLKNYLKEEHSKNCFDCVISFGFPWDPLKVFGEELAKFVGAKNYFSIEQASPCEELLEQVPENSKVILITDALYSGRTAQNIISQLKQRKVEIVKLLSLTAGSATNKKEIDEVKIETLVYLDLPWWDNNQSKCPLCEIGFNVIEYGGEHKITPEGLTPWEFYEFLYRADALIEGKFKMPTGNSYRYIIDTSKFFDKFGIWIAKMLKEHLEKYDILNKIAYIVCPEDPNRAAIFLSHCISSLIQKKKIVPIIPVCRNDLHAWKSPKPAYIAKIRKKYEVITNKPVLIIDDGINTMKTYNSFIRFLTEIMQIKEKDIYGPAVFLSRLEYSKFSHFKSYNTSFLWIYDLPIPPFLPKKFPYE